MIEPTPEMRAAYEQAAAAETGWIAVRASTAGLAAVLAIVERDHDVAPKLPPVEHRMRRELWWNHYAEGWEAECVCGESFAYWQRSEAEDRLLDHIEAAS